VFDGRLDDHEYLAGDYSIADIANCCWVRTHPWPRVSTDRLDYLQRWLGAIGECAAVQKGVAVPQRIEMPAGGAKKMVEDAQKIVQR
jgi:GST-like protein